MDPPRQGPKENAAMKAPHTDTQRFFWVGPITTLEDTLKAQADKVSP